MNSIKKLWNSKWNILTGMFNNLFKKAHIEKIYRERLSICRSCPKIDIKGDKCFAPGTQPCCGECGCKLGFKLRVLSESCPDPDGPRWLSIPEN